MAYIKRQIEKELKILSKEFPIVTIMGPRQSGKTTMIKNVFPKYEYVSLEDLNMRDLAENDPKSFLEKFSKKTIIDEVQYAPKLFPYLQIVTDEKNQAGQYIIAGSQNYLLLNKISQSLAGRVGVARLLPFSYQEIKSLLKNKNTSEIMFSGFYPRIFKEKIRPASFYDAYITTYLEKDVASIFKIKNLEQFRGFLKLLASRSGQILNINSLAGDLSVSRSTLKEWLNILESSFIIFKNPPFFKNYKKQVIKSDKIFFYDTGLLCHLLGIESARQLDKNYLVGNIFETLVVSEFLKNDFNRGRRGSIYYWRDNKGREIDLVKQRGAYNDGYEIKKSKTISDNFFKNLLFWEALEKNNRKNLIYDGEEEYSIKKTKIINWRKIF